MIFLAISNKRVGVYLLLVVSFFFKIELVVLLMHVYCLVVLGIAFQLLFNF